MPTTDREALHIPPSSLQRPGRSATVTGAEARDAGAIRRDEKLGVVNGALYQGGEGFIDSNTVIPVFLSTLTTSNAAIGLATAMGET